MVCSCYLPSCSYSQVIPVSHLDSCFAPPSSSSSINILPVETSSIIVSGQTPEWTLAVRNLTAWQKETKPRNDTADSSLRWCEVSFTLLSSVSMRGREKAGDWQQTPSEHLCCKNMHYCASEKPNTSWSWTVCKLLLQQTCNFKTLGCVLGNTTVFRFTITQMIEYACCIMQTNQQTNKHRNSNHSGLSARVNNSLWSISPAFLVSSGSSQCFPIHGENNWIIWLF